ncbi:RNA polymerase sigma factor [Fulvivirga sp. M361]|uniref:RNA polymerase sigma factor n=1 Tax=Fulvivirga sp. M361 TaxID=2594266 RepID=UPI00117AE053|nr:RNA polymerase sigma factor [Fulvivirga sp. M361]TRX49329.1 RNA polymerase sigma factor [Fulvivirga sp. M361]
MTKEELTTTFEEIKGSLKSYILRVTASIQDAEDIVQDTYVKALEKIDTFRGDSSLKTWIFAISFNLAKDNLRVKKRWTENVTDICKEAAMSNRPFFQKAMEIRTTSPQGQFEIKEHIAFCFTCVSKSLPLEQHVCLLLKEVYEFKVKEIARITEISEAMVKYYLHTGRSKMVDVFQGRCALIHKEGVCHQCTELNGIFNPQQKAEEELVKIEMARKAESADKEHLFDLRMNIVKGIDPFESDAAELQLHHLEHNREVMEKYLEKNKD